MEFLEQCFLAFLFQTIAPSVRNLQKKENEAILINFVNLKMVITIDFFCKDTKLSKSMGTAFAQLPKFFEI